MLTIHSLCYQSTVHFIPIISKISNVKASKRRVLKNISNCSFIAGHLDLIFLEALYPYSVTYLGSFYLEILSLVTMDLHIVPT